MRVTQASTAQQSVDEGPIQSLFGRFMLPDMSEYPCRVTGITTEGAVFHAEHVPPPGQSIVAYLEELGRIEAVSGEAIDDGFKIAFSVKGARLEKLESRIKWLGHKQNADKAEGRRHARFEPRDSKSQFTLPDGRVYSCEVIDISVSGAGIKVEVLPAIGTHVLLGKMRGRVVRHLDSGLAIEFLRQLDNQQLGAVV